MAKHAVFFDRDGTLIVEKHYLSDPAGVELVPGAHEALLSLQKAGYTLFIVSNQSGVGRGLFSLEDMDRVNQRMLDLLPGVKFEKMYFCTASPDSPEGHTRKPSPKFLFEVERDFHVNLRKSWFVGDKDIDVMCGLNAGCQSILIDGIYGEESRKNLEGKKFLPVSSLTAAVGLIINS